MASKTYNNFHLGLAQDDHKTWGKAFIDSKNLDWLNTGYWVTLWPKPNKLFTTTSPMRGIYIDPLLKAPKDENHVTFWDNWEVYVLWLATDNTPTYTFPDDVRWCFGNGLFYYFLYVSSPWSTWLNLARVASANVYDWSFTWIDLNFSNDFCNTWR